MKFTRLERLILVIGMSISMIVAAYAAVSKLSQIAASGSNLASGDKIVGVTAGNVDLLFSPAQIAAQMQTQLGTKTILAANTNPTYNVNASTGVDVAGCGGSGNPCLTIQFAVNIVAGLDIGLATNHVIIKVADGTYAGNIVLPSYTGVDKGATWNGTAVQGVELQGNFTTPANCIISTNSALTNPLIIGAEGGPQSAGIFVSGPGIIWSVRGFTMNKTGSGQIATLNVRVQSQLNYDKMVFGANVTGYHVYSVASGADDIGGNGANTFAGGAIAAYWAEAGEISVGAALTLTGTPAFSLAFLTLRSINALVFWQPASVTGTATGKTFDLFALDKVVLFTALSTIPGNAQGTMQKGAIIADPNNNIFYGAADIYTVATLPPVTMMPKGYTAVVTDSNQTVAANGGAIVTGGGAAVVPVYNDGTNWRVL